MKLCEILQEGKDITSLINNIHLENDVIAVLSQIKIKFGNLKLVSDIDPDDDPKVFKRALKSLGIKANQDDELNLDLDYVEDQLNKLNFKYIEVPAGPGDDENYGDVWYKDDIFWVSLGGGDFGCWIFKK